MCIRDRNTGEVKPQVMATQQDTEPEKKGITIGLTIGGGEVSPDDQTDGDVYKRQGLYGRNRS